MKRLAILLLAAAALAATPAAAQTIKSLGYNTTNGHVVYSGTNALTFTNALSFGTNAAATAANLGVGSTNNVSFGGLTVNGTLEIGDGNTLFVDGEIGINAIFNFDKEIRFSNTTNAAVTRTNLGLGATNAVEFARIDVGGALTITNSQIAGQGITIDFSSGTFSGDVLGNVRSSIGLGSGITTNVTFVDASTNTNSVTISNGIITGWTQ